MKRIETRSGVTLIELLVVIVIIGVLMASLGFFYQGWMGRYNVESQIRQIYSDLMNARIKAMQNNRFQFLTFPNATSYTMYEDTNGNGTLQTASDTQLAGFPKQLKYAFTWTGGVIPNDVISFDMRGFVSSPGILANPNNSNYHDKIRINTTLNADYDCICLSQTKISTGKWNATSSECDVK